MAMVHLVVDHDIVEASLAIDTEFWRVHRLVRDGADQGGRVAGRPTSIEARCQDFINVARKSCRSARETAATSYGQAA